VKPGNLVYATGEGLRAIPERGVGLVTQVEDRIDGARSMGEQIYRIFWIGEAEPAWYYEHEVEFIPLRNNGGCK